MRDFPRKNCLLAGSLALFSAACFAGAACFNVQSQHGGVAALLIVLALGEAGLGVFLFKKSRKAA